MQITLLYLKLTQFSKSTTLQLKTAYVTCEYKLIKLLKIGRIDMVVVV